jgi:F-type H+-transporting ATPase subunit b
MLFLAEFSVFTVDPGLAFWTLLIFIILWVLLGKFAFKPIAQALEDRSTSIDNALKQAELARQEMANLKSENEKIMAKASEERASIIKEAKLAATEMVNDAKEKAKEEAQRLIANAKIEIENQQKSAMIQVKNEVGSMAIQIAEKIIRKELSKDAAQVDFAKSLVDNIKLN